ncbi:MAG: hypothetical protein WB791_01880 [Waddliaceae bacterium]
MDLLYLIISLISGAAGGNIAGALLKERNLGFIANTLSGIFGGGIGGAILQFLGFISSSGLIGPEGNIDVGALIANIASSGVGGAVLSSIVTYLKDQFNK